MEQNRREQEDWKDESRHDELFLAWRQEAGQTGSSSRRMRLMTETVPVFPAVRSCRGTCVVKGAVLRITSLVLVLVVRLKTLQELVWFAT